MRSTPRRASAAVSVVLCGVGMLTGIADAGVAFGLTPTGLGGGYRWDAAPRSFNFSGTNYERSLNGGLRFSMSGGSYQAFRDRFSWNVVPSVADFSSAVNQAFNAWGATDPATSLGSNLSFSADFATPVVGVAGGGGGVDTRGAEIDLIASNDAFFWDPGNNGTQGETWFNAAGSTVTLTSGTANYSAAAISGADIAINSNPGAVYSLDLFRRLLTHEIGHALGLGDVEGDINPGVFIDDNFSLANPVGTLNNSWALLVNTANPAASPLSRFTVPFGNPGTTTPGVDLLMESRGLGIAPGNPITSLVPLTNDEYGTRQFLYPWVPAPGGLGLLAMLGAGAVRRRRES